MRGPHQIPILYGKAKSDEIVYADYVNYGCIINNKIFVLPMNGCYNENSISNLYVSKDIADAMKMKKIVKKKDMGISDFIEEETEILISDKRTEFSVHPFFKIQNTKIEFENTADSLTYMLDYYINGIKLEMQKFFPDTLDLFDLVNKKGIDINKIEIPELIEMIKSLDKYTIVDYEIEEVDMSGETKQGDVISKNKTAKRKKVIYGNDEINIRFILMELKSYSSIINEISNSYMYLVQFKSLISHFNSILRQFIMNIASFDKTILLNKGKNDQQKTIDFSAILDYDNYDDVILHMTNVLIDNVERGSYLNKISFFTNNGIYPILDKYAYIDEIVMLYEYRNCYEHGDGLLSNESIKRLEKTKFNILKKGHQLEKINKEFFESSMKQLINVSNALADAIISKYNFTSK